MAEQFEGQYEDEEVLFTFRRHPITMRKGFYFLLTTFLLGSIPTFINPDNVSNLLYALGGLLLGLVFFLYFWLWWYFSVFIVTNQRLRQVSQKGFFNKSVIDLSISKIQNISYNVPGISASLFGYGTVVIQTYVGDLYLDKVHHPSRIYNDISKVIKRYGNEASGEIRNEVSKEK